MGYLLGNPHVFNLNDDKMKILALDIATKTGWKTETSSGIWDFKPNRGESEGMRVVRFKARVREMIGLENITLVSYERAAGRHKSSIIVESEMIGVLKDLCIELGVDNACYSAKEIKMFATGNGNASKDMLFDKAVELGYHPLDNNESDAIWIYLLTKKDVGE